MIVLGIDPGLNVTGYGAVSFESGVLTLLEAGVIRTHARDLLEKRLFELYTGFIEILDDHNPAAISVEDLYAHYKHPKTAVIMGHARGVFFLSAGARGIPIYSYSATRIKKSLTGMGHASKEQVARMIGSTLCCSTDGIRSDVTDALAAALCHINTQNHEVYP